ncbi:hypothetical protein B0I35DRAFT_440010 [Stachybotrys elegans]|uniref:Uncharacterized protein n=1 Tax=Stachybotrys elegans TaxID=80388 RepID=A0A8K0SGN8_9HYPO|nr:hypothetical protein B0I35DRAFT_440010 [Stachybotrys elegans]
MAHERMHGILPLAWLPGGGAGRSLCEGWRCTRLDSEVLSFSLLDCCAACTPRSDLCARCYVRACTSLLRRGLNFSSTYTYR